MHRTLFILVLLAAASTGAAQEPKFTLSADGQKLLDMTNAERKKKDLPPLKANPTLFKVARAHAANMAKQGKMEHELDGKNPYERIKTAGYRFRVAAENIARSQQELDDVMKGWMNSKAHRDNILAPEFNEIGLGLAKGDNDTVYFAQVFATPLK